MVASRNRSRRSVLGGAAVTLLGLSGCAPTPPAASPPRSTGLALTGPAAPTTTVPAPGSGVFAPVPAPETSVTPPTRRQLLDRYRSAAPTAWGLTTPGVRLTLGPAERVVALTFDACGGPGSGSGYDEALIALLRRHRVRATLFLNSRWMAANPGVTAELLADPLFEIGNHGTRHVPLSVSGRSAYGIRGTRGPGEVYDEIMTNQTALAGRMGRGPAWFRPGTAFCDDVAVRIAGDLGVRVAGFSVNGDEGATAGRAVIADRLDTVRAGDIVISHFNHPERETYEGYRNGLPRLLERGLEPVMLSEVNGS